VLFDGCDADFELEAFVDFALLELGQLGVELFDAAIEARLDCGETYRQRYPVPAAGGGPSRTWARSRPLARQSGEYFA
jgi:hypothetical protein